MKGMEKPTQTYAERHIDRLPLLPELMRGSFRLNPEPKIKDSQAVLRKKRPEEVRAALP